MKTICWFDLETTGKNKAVDRIIQMSIIKTSGLQDIIEKKKLYFNNDGVKINPEAIEAHGITEDMLKDKRPFKSYAKIIYDYIQNCDYIGGFNIKYFDIPLLAEEFARSGLDWIPKPAIDSSVIYKKYEQRNLTAALNFYCGEQLDGAHDAENDVVATIKVAFGQVFRYGFDMFQLENETIEDILVKESKYENEVEQLDFHGKIILNQEGVPIWNFGKYKDKNTPVKQDRGYCDWCLKLEEFPQTTKNLIKRILNGVL